MHSQLHRCRGGSGHSRQHHAGTGGIRFCWSSDLSRSVKSKFIGGLFRIVPLLLSWIGILVAASSGDLRTAGPVFASLLAMVIMRVAIYEMVKGVVK